MYRGGERDGVSSGARRAGTGSKAGRYLRGKGRSSDGSCDSESVECLPKSILLSPSLLFCAEALVEKADASNRARL